MKNSTKKFNNKKGFSLVELIVAVCILGVIVVPIMNSFVTSSSISTKSQKMSEATDTANSILDLLNSTPISKFQTGSENIASILGEDVEITVDSDNTINSPYDDATVTKPGDDEHYQDQVYYIDGIKAGSSDLFAKVTMTLGEQYNSDTRAFYEINTAEIASYRNANDIFYQSSDWTNNPDAIFTKPGIEQGEKEVGEETSGALTEIGTNFTSSGAAAEYNLGGLVLRLGDDSSDTYGRISNIERLIRIDIDQGAGEAIVQINYYYYIEFEDGDGYKQAVTWKSSQYDGTIEFTSADWDNPASLYVMYYPFFKDDSLKHCQNGIGTSLTGTAMNSGETVNFISGTDVIEIHNDSGSEPVPLRLYLVKQRPVKYTIDEEKDEESGIVTGTSVACEEYEDDELIILQDESHYNVQIKEYVSESYYNNIKNRLNLFQKQVYTNAAYSLISTAEKESETGEENGAKIPHIYNYYSIGPANASLSQGTELDSLGGAVIGTEMLDRIYKVTIEIYNADSVETDEETKEIQNEAVEVKTYTLPDKSVYKMEGTALIKTD